MTEIVTLSSGELGVNSYFLINNETKKAILIDGGEDYELIKSKEKELGIVITDLILTHGHYDHAGNAKKLQDDGIKVGICTFDADKLSNADSLASDFNKTFESLKPDYTFDDDQTLDINGISLKVLRTPGHTSGSCCFILGDVIFSGDTLFCNSFGRTDMRDGNLWDMIKSIRRLVNLEGDYQVYPGHDRKTTLSYEREHNPMALYVKNRRN